MASPSRWILVLGGWYRHRFSDLGQKKSSRLWGRHYSPSQWWFHCAELATATTILVASRLVTPVSRTLMLSSAALLGLVSIRSIQFKTVQGIAWAWLITMPISAGLGASIFTVARLLFL